MTPELHSKLNDILKQHGTIPYGPNVGQGIFQFRRSGELKLAFRTGEKTLETESGLAVVVPVFEWKLQLPDIPHETWCIAKWLNPDEKEWDRQHESQLEWPKHGYFYCFQQLEIGKEPTEDWTKWVADHLHFQREMSLKEHVRNVMGMNQKKQDTADERTRDLVKECFVNHVPGARGGSYISFNAPAKA